jgi:hypothetical protein
MARNTLAKMAVEARHYFPGGHCELAVTLTGGTSSMSACCRYTQHSFTAICRLQTPILSGEQLVPPLPFDKAVPALMDLIQQDLFLVWPRRKGRRLRTMSHVRKEAGGSRVLILLK